MTEYSLFAYKFGNSFLHKMPTFIKILLLPILNILIINSPIVFVLILIIIQFVIFCLLKFPLKMQFTDFKPVFIYAFFVLFAKLITCFLGKLPIHFEKETIFFLIKLFCIFQTTSLFFKTSSSIEIRNGIYTIEFFVHKFFRLKSNFLFTDLLSLFIIFIPLVFRNWTQIKTAWKIRKGKQTIKMYFILIPVLFSVCIKQANNINKSLLIRK